MAMKQHMAPAMSCLRDPGLNQGTAFTHEQRMRLAIDGLLPPRVESLQEQASRVRVNLRALTSPLEKYRYLAALQSENETLFYRVVLDQPEEMLPLIYTPTVGQACLEWSRIYERSRGLYLSQRHRGHMAQVLRNWPRGPVRVIVVTDGGRILGLGDLGANGMGIAVGKLALYTACAGVRPDACLPVTLDAGTDREALRNDPLYIGERHTRTTGAAWDELLEEFLLAVAAVFPEAIVQFEDFNSPCAFRLLQRYRERLCCFNDDIQGTGAMGLAGLHAACRVTGEPLATQRLLFVGAGEACLGIGAAVIAALRRAGMNVAAARERCLFMDSKGLVISARNDLVEHKRAYAQDRDAVPDLLAAIERFSPTALIGATGQGGLFTQPVLEAMARLNPQPIVFALSNPTAKSECTAEQAYGWTNGRALYACGSLIPPVTYGGRVHAPGQANNCHVFPGVGMGLLVARARRVTDEMLLAAAQALAAQVTDDDLKQGRLFPLATRMRDVAVAVATAVAAVAHQQGHAAAPRPVNLRGVVAAAMYEPCYAVEAL
jgi:malate dehydrogenase (oxaloacetate-decarboxylating)(NADP+)